MDAKNTCSFFEVQIRLVVTKFDALRHGIHNVTLSPMLKSVLCEECTEHFVKFAKEDEKQYGLSIRLCYECAEANKETWAKYYDKYGYFPLLKGDFLGTRCFHVRVYRGNFLCSFLKKRGKEMKYAYLDHFTKLWFPYGWKTHKDVIVFESAICEKCYMLPDNLVLSRQGDKQHFLIVCCEHCDKIQKRLLSYNGRVLFTETGHLQIAGDEDKVMDEWDPYSYRQLVNEEHNCDKVKQI